MTVATIDTSEFESIWKQADVRFPYALNRGLLILYGGLLAGFWAYWAVSVLNGGLDLVLGIIGGVFGLVTVFVAFNIMYWRHFARFSGAICTEEALLWRQGNDAWSAPWGTIDFDELGLMDFDPQTRKYEYFWSIGGRKLYLYRAHVRMRSMEVFMGVALKSLKEAGRTPIDPQGNPGGSKSGQSRARRDQSGQSSGKSSRKPSRSDRRKGR